MLNDLAKYLPGVRFEFRSIGVDELRLDWHYGQAFRKCQSSSQARNWEVEGDLIDFCQRRANDGEVGFLVYGGSRDHRFRSGGGCEVFLRRLQKARLLLRPISSMLG